MKLTTMKGKMLIIAILLFGILPSALYAQNGDDDRKVIRIEGISGGPFNENYVDWSRVYNDTYYFSTEKSAKSVILFAHKDSTITVWVDGVKDTANYDRKKRRPYSFESWDNGVTYALACFKYGQLYVRSSGCSFNGAGSTGIVHHSEVAPIVFGNAGFYSCPYFKEDIDWTKLTPTHIMRLNNTAYYLQQIETPKSRECAISLLKILINIAPNRTVAYINLGDAYWGLNEKENAKQAYRKYIELMKKSGKESKIPQRVFDRVGN